MAGRGRIGPWFRVAIVALRRGWTVVVHPEGTVTRDPDLWPVQARTGVARLALLSGAPVVPVAQWGAQSIRRRWRRTRVSFRVGPPVDLSPWAGRAHTAEVLRGVRAPAPAGRGQGQARAGVRP